MFTITMLPAAIGDCLWIEYGDPSKPNRILIDCGMPPTHKTLRKRIEELGSRAFIELLIITHVDTDHIGGVLPLFGDPPKHLRVGEVWFNGWGQITPDARDFLGPKEGEVLGQMLVRGFPWKNRSRWNTRFGRGGRVPVAIRTTGPLPSYTLAGGMKLTLLSPGKTQLERLRPVWERVCREAGLTPGVRSSRLEEIARKKGVDFLGARDPIKELAEAETGSDSAEANGSTIAILAEYRDDDGKTKRCILAGDAHPDVLARSLKRLAKERRQRRLHVDAFKLPHHGSERNVTKDVIEAVDCKKFLFSSNSTVFKSPHPHATAVARAIQYSDPGITLHFNYRTGINDQWENAAWMRRYRYDVDFGDTNGTCLVTL